MKLKDQNDQGRGKGRKLNPHIDRRKGRKEGEYDHRMDKTVLEIYTNVKRIRQLSLGENSMGDNCNQQHGVTLNTLHAMLLG